MRGSLFLLGVMLCLVSGAPSPKLETLAPNSEVGQVQNEQSKVSQAVQTQPEEIHDPIKAAQGVVATQKSEEPNIGLTKSQEVPTTQATEAPKVASNTEEVRAAPVTATQSVAATQTVHADVPAVSTAEKLTTEIPKVASNTEEVRAAPVTATQSVADVPAVSTAENLTTEIPKVASNTEEVHAAPVPATQSVATAQDLKQTSGPSVVALSSQGSTEQTPVLPKTEEASMAPVAVTPATETEPSLSAAPVSPSTEVPTAVKTQASEASMMEPVAPSDPQQSQQDVKEHEVLAKTESAVSAASQPETVSPTVASSDATSNQPAAQTQTQAAAQPNAEASPLIEQAPQASPNKSEASAPVSTGPVASTSTPQDSKAAAAVTNAEPKQDHIPIPIAPPTQEAAKQPEPSTPTKSALVDHQIDTLKTLSKLTPQTQGTEALNASPINKILLNYDQSDVSVCIPCIPRDISNLPDLIRTIDANTVQPKEIIVAISDTNDEQARNLEDILNTVAPHIRVTNTPESHYAGANRNRCASLASGRFVTFIDADDEMHFQRLQIVKEALEETGSKCVLHGFSMDQKDLRKEFHWHDAFQLKGSQIYSNMLNKEGTDSIQLKPHGLHIKSKYNKFGPHHGHPSCRKEVLETIKFPDEPRGQDSLFLRQLLQHYGPIEESLLFIDLPLSIYHPSDHEDNAGIRK